MVCCPLTTQIKSYPFEVVITGTPSSVVLADQVKSLDWRQRQATRKGRVSRAELADVRAKIRPDWVMASYRLTPLRPIR
jgi:mRNA interferase MazF